jgi:outer membrane biosynthesis protein TonB
MKLKFWKGRESPEPEIADKPEVADEPEAPPAPVSSPSRPEPVPADPPPAAHEVPPEQAPPEEPSPPEVPAQVSLTIDEAKGVIREAGGDVIQVGFLASAYRRNLEEDPGSAETAASRKRLRELVGKRLKDRGLLAPDGSFELRESSAAPTSSNEHSG